MKHPRRPTLRQKKLIASYNLDPTYWQIVKDCSECFEIYNIVTGERRKMNRLIA